MPLSSRLSALVEKMWESDTLGARLTRGLLAPAEALFSIAVARRNHGYDRAEASDHAPTSRYALAALSVGNLTVGGTGKTPIAAWCVQQLRARGAKPAVVMRGYGDDEWRVHALLNRGVPVIVSPDRSAGVLTARVQGADCAVLDDAFQHRKLRRVVDLVLVSADQWRDRVRMLPAGPYREPLTAICRADVAIITVKAASEASVSAAVGAVRNAAPNVPIAVVRLLPGTLRLAATLLSPGEQQLGVAATRVPSTLTREPGWLSGRDVVIASAVGNPSAFEAQLRGLGALVGAVHRFPDHHEFTTSDAVRIASSAAGSAGAVCTLKDAVKLTALWPREAPPLWYVSQAVVVERGVEVLDRALARVLAARATAVPTAD